MSIRLYTGEYLSHPAPVHFGMNWCTHSCFYCFANLNKPERRTETNDLLRLVKWARDKRGPLEWWWLSQGHPMLVSNDSDPLAKSNAETFSELHRISRDQDIRLMFQTKGGSPDAESMMLDRPPTTIDITITSDDSRLLKQIEPGAPSFEQRLELIRKAKACGHHVIVSMLPFVASWWNDFESALAELHSAGARHIWYSDLHLSRFQLANMSAATKKRFASDIQYAMLKVKPDAIAAESMIRYADSVGFNCYDSYESTKPDFWQPHFDLGYPFFPTLPALFDALNTYGKGKPVCFDFEWFDEWANINAPGNKSIYRDYIVSFGRSIRNAGCIQKANSMREVHEWYWKVCDFPTPLRHRNLHIATAPENGKERLLVDSEDRILMIYVPGGTKNQFYSVENCAVLTAERR